MELLFIDKMEKMHASSSFPTGSAAGLLPNHLQPIRRIKSMESHANTRLLRFRIKPMFNMYELYTSKE